MRLPFGGIRDKLFNGREYGIGISGVNFPKFVLSNIVFCVFIFCYGLAEAWALPRIEHANVQVNISVRDAHVGRGAPAPLAEQDIAHALSHFDALFALVTAKGKPVAQHHANESAAKPEGGGGGDRVSLDKVNHANKRSSRDTVFIFVVVPLLSGIFSGLIISLLWNWWRY